MDNFDLKKYLTENKLTSNSRQLDEVSSSRVKYKIGDKVKLKSGKYDGKVGTIRTTYAKKHNSSEGKDKFEIYFPHLKSTVSWFKPTDLEKVGAVNEDIYGGQFGDDYFDYSEYISQLVKDTVTHFEREVTLGNLEPEDITLKMIKDTAGVDSKVAKQIAIEIEDLFNLMPATIKEEEDYDIRTEVKKGKILQASDGGEIYKVTSVTPTQVTLIDLEDGTEEIFPDDYKSNPKVDYPSIEDFWGYYDYLDSEHKKKLKDLKSNSRKLEEEAYGNTQDIEVGMRVLDKHAEVFEVIEVNDEEIVLEPIGVDDDNVVFKGTEDEFWRIYEPQEEERTGMFGEPYDSDEEGGIPFFSKGLREVVDDNTLENNINNLESEDIFTITGEPSSFMDDEEKVLQGLLKVIKKVNPEVDLDKKKMSFSRDFDKTIENLKSAQWKSFSVERGVKDYFIKNLFMFK